MASRSNVPKDVLDSIRESLDRRIKLSIKRLVKYEVRPDRWENRVVAFSNNRLFVFTAKNPTKIENKFHYLDLHSIESPKPNKLSLTFGEKSYSFTTLEGNTDEVDHMVTHICTSVKTVFPAFPVERMIKKIDVQPSERLRVMHDMVNSIEHKETGPCGGFTLMYDCMCEFHELPFRDEVSWDVDTIYLSQDSKELCLRDFDHLNPRDLVPIVSALIHNPWFTVLNANNVRLSAEVCTEILHVIQKNSVIESLQLSNTGISNDFLQKLSTSILSMSSTQLHKLDISNNPMLDDRGIIHLIGSLSSLGKGMTYLDLSKTKLSTKGIKSVAEIMSKNSQVFSSLQTLILAELSGGKAEDLQMLYQFLAQPSMISHLDLSGTDCELERLMAPLQRGCSQNITYLKLSRTSFTYKRVKEIVVPSSFKQFFATVYSLKTLNLSGCRIPPEALKELLLGLGSNRNISNVELNLSSMELQSQGIQNLQNSLSKLNNITSLNISNIVFSDQDLSSVLNSIGQNKTIKHLSIGRVFQKVKNLNTIMEELVHVIQDEESVIESLSLADSRLKSNMNQIINALGSNTSLTELDISGNSMGDLGARMLSKALQINNKLKTIMWDRNNTTAQGFEDIADALEKNYTLRKMPVPISDASSASRNQPERTEAALQSIERLLQRNHSPQKYSSDQAYRLQQGFLISSTQQMVDRLVVQSQDTINALSIDPQDSYSKDIESTEALIKDANNSKMLLPKLHDIAIESQNPGNPVEVKIKEIAEDLKTVLENQMKKSVEDMLESTKQQCKAIMGDEVFTSALQAGCNKNSLFPKDFTTNILAAVDNEIFNKLSELNLAVAAHVSDKILDEVIDRLSKNHKTLTNHLNMKKKNEMRSSKTKSEKLNLDTTDDGKLRPNNNSPQASPKVAAKRQSMLTRKLRPQSVIEKIRQDISCESSARQRIHMKHNALFSSKDRDRLAVNNEAARPVTVPQAKRSPRLGSRSPKVKKSRPKQPVPDIEVTYANVSNAIGLKQDERIYDNAKNVIYMNVGKPGEVYRPEREETRDSADDHQELAIKTKKSEKIRPDVSSESSSRQRIHIKSIKNQALFSSKDKISAKVRKKDEDVLGDLPTLTVETQKLTHLTTDRPKVTKRANRTRPTTRKSQLPGTNEAVDEGLDDFFGSRPDDLSITPVAKVTPDSKKNVKADSNKSEPESKKKHGLFSRGNSKEKEHKDKDHKKGLLGKFKKSDKVKHADSPKSSRKLSQVGEEQVDGDVKDESLSQKGSETSSQRSSQEKRRSNQSHLTGSEADSSSIKSGDSKDSGSIKDNKSEVLEENETEEKEEQTEESGTEEGTTEEELDEEGSESQEEIIEEKKSEVKRPLQLPKVQRSFEKSSEKKKEVDSNSDKTDDDDGKSEEDQDKDDIEKEDKSTEDVSEDQEEKKPDEEEKKEEPAVMRKPVGVPTMLGGLGGTNMMAELKAKQEKRKSQMPFGPKTPDKPDRSPTGSTGSIEEKHSPFGGVNLKSVSDRKSKDKTDDKKAENDNSIVSLKPVSDRKSKDKTDTENSGVSLKPVADRKSKEKIDGENKDSEITLRPSSVKQTENKDKESDARDTETTVRPSSLKQSELAKLDKLGSTPGKQPAETSEPSSGEKPSKPTAPAKPVVATRPRPPPVGSKPKPAPRRSLQSDPDEFAEEVENANNKTNTEEKKDIVASSTTKVSVKEEIAKLRTSSEKPDLTKQGKPPSKTDIVQGTVLAKPKTMEEKSESIKRDMKSGSIQKQDVEAKPVKPSEVKKDESVKGSQTSEAGVIDHKTEENKDMTDSGIVYDSDTLKLSVKDKASRFGSKDEVSDGKVSPKSGSLTRGVKPSDVKESEAPRRPRSMLAVLEKNPDLKKSEEKRDMTPKSKESEEITEEKRDSKDSESSADQVVMV